MFFHLLPFRYESQGTGVEFAECQGTWFYGLPQARQNVQVSIYITDPVPIGTLKKCKAMGRPISTKFQRPIIHPADKTLS